MLSSGSRVRCGFTLVEILVVVGILALLAAILFPIVGRARESARQTSCLSNLHQIGLAVTQYSQDFGGNYPSSLAGLVPSLIHASGGPGGASHNDGYGGGFDPTTTTPGGGLNSGTHGSGGSSTFEASSSEADYLRSDRALRCDDDSLSPGWLRSSYGVLIGQAQGVNSSGNEREGETDDYEPLMWNYFGYSADGTAFVSSFDAAQGAAQPGAGRFLRNPNLPYNARFNPFKASMANRFSPPNTIITHCRFHRPATSGLNDPNALYKTPSGQGARDAVLRLDGSAHVLDVSNFNSTGAWQMSISVQ